MDMVQDTYSLSKQLPESEKYGLRWQTERAAVSIPSNIAEGSKRTSRNDFRHFCLTALGSAAELETQLLISRLYPEVNTGRLNNQVTDIQKMFTSLAKKLNDKQQAKNNKR